ncbi:MAG: 3-hydroxyacyl-[acyl-carrier-protein] dehydratase [Planctomycetota bacterium]|jgi:3-hydroxyacyl-[acyl-carrier-protein] dehydratase
MGKPIVDLATLDLSKDVVSDEVLRRCLPQAGTFQLLDGICHLDVENNLAVGYKDWDEDPWWAKAHIPGRPLMPGVLMIEGGAQIATFLVKQQAAWATDQMIGLAGIDDVRVRGQVVPPGRVYFVSSIQKISGRRLARMNAQVFSEGAMKMEMVVMGAML